MIGPGKIKTLVASEQNVVLLYAAAFFQSCGGAILFVCIPFILKRLGGSDTQLGLCLGLWFGAYLTGCLCGSVILDYFNAKHAVQFSSGVTTLVLAAVLATIVLAENGYCPVNPVLALIILLMLGGLLTSLFWAPLMGWISTGYEGSQLNRRLGIFNIAWSFGAVVTSYLGGLLVERGSSWPLIGAIVFGILSFVAVSFAKSSKQRGSGDAVSQNNEKPPDIMPALLPRFRWMARVALFTSFICIGLARTQLAILFRFELNLLESTYGTAVMIMCLAGFIVFFLAGKTHLWHYRGSVFVTAQLALLASMWMILKSDSTWILFAATALIGSGQAFMYASQLYYGVSGGKRRSGLMALHEIILSVGFATGSIAGGFLSDHFDRYAPYWFGFAAVVAGLVVQAFIWFTLKPKQNSSGTECFV